MSEPTSTALALHRAEEPPRWLAATTPMSRDLAVVGGVTAVLAAAGLGGSALSLFSLVAGAAAATLGALLGRLGPLLLGRRVRRVRVPFLLGAGAGLGALWGATAGALAALVAGTPLLPAVVDAARLGMLQLGWLWLPYLLLRARGRATWPLVTLAAAVTPLLALLVRAWH